MTKNQKTLSVLFILLFMTNSNKRVLKKGFKKLQLKTVERSCLILRKNIDRKTISLQMYVNQSLIQYSRDEDLFLDIQQMTDEEYEQFLKNKDNNIVNVESFKDDGDTSRFVFIIYSGGKSNHKTMQQEELIKILTNNPNITKYFEPFLGGFGSVYNSLSVLLKYGVKDIFLSDTNNSLVNCYRQVQRNPKIVQKWLASIDIEYFRLYGKYYPDTKDESKEWFEEIHRRFTELEKSKKMNPKRAAYFMYLNSNTQGGMLNFNMKTKLNKMHHSFCSKKVKRVPLLINKVEIFHKIFNMGNIKFSVCRYETVLKKVNNDTNSLVLLDPPYVKYEEEKTSDNILSCSYNYGINNFNHRQLLTKMKNSQCHFMYYNNHNPYIEEFSQKHSYKYIKKDVIYRNGKEGKKSVEIFMVKDNSKVTSNIVNNVDFFKEEVQKVS
ncbi:hypothetical protein ACH5BK_06060 [Arcobacter sp. YIC-80]|uniref:hypothetical protein n=1 Tax=Arcobacter sp. YIC-80 TaxID=3376683 RepID=UPI00384D939D